MGAKAASLAGLLPEALPEPPKDADAIIDEEELQTTISARFGSNNAHAHGEQWQDEDDEYDDEDADGPQCANQ